MHLLRLSLVIVLLAACSGETDSGVDPLNNSNNQSTNNLNNTSSTSENNHNNTNNTNSVTPSCVPGEPPVPDNPFTSGPECELRYQLEKVECAEGTCETLIESMEWCQYGACGASNQATCAPYEVATVPVQYGVETTSGECRQMCRLYRFTEVVCGTTYGCEIHDAGWDICCRKYATGIRVRMCQFTWNCWVDESYEAQDWCSWMLGNPGPSGYSHLIPYKQELSEIEEIPIPYIDIEGECPLAFSELPELPDELRGLPVKREAVPYFDTSEDGEIPADYDISAAACNDSLPYADDYIVTMCENI